MESEKFGVHEVTDLRELINFKIACLTQSKSRMEKVEDLELKALIEQSIEQGSATVGQMRDLLSSAATQMRD